jgi:carboxymethylenebutenolidase
MGKMIEITTFDHDGQFGAYLAEPAGAARGAIVVIQEIFGINAGIRKMCDDHAAKGYVAIAPDLFWRVKPGVELDPDVEAEFMQGVDYMMKLDTDTTIRDIEATIREARARGGGKVGVVGYCMGGRLTYLAACRTDADAFASYYGGGIDQSLGESHAIANPLVMHLAEEDKFIDKTAQAAIHQALDGNPHVTIYDYPGQDHAFARAVGHSRNEQAAQLADGRTAEFFARQIG